MQSPKNKQERWKKSLEKISDERPDNLVIQEYMQKVEEALKI